MDRLRFELFPQAFALAVLALSLGGCDLLGFGSGAPKEKRQVDRGRENEAPAELSYVGREKCSQCHEEIVQGYAWSQHDRALEIPEGKAVLAPFEGEKLTGRNVSATFIKKDGKPVIQSDKEYPIKWTIGLEPLQQYLIETERGRVQAFPLAYDVRDLSAGGKRWYTLNDMDVPPGDVLHWQGPALNWNYMCADCHSTNVQKNYDLETDSYKTTFTEIDVSCEACHGPASRHVEAANKYKDIETWPPEVANAGFDLALATYALRRWVRLPDEKVASLQGNGDAPPEKTDELLSCAPCHSRRSDLGPAPATPTHPDFNERYRLSLLTSELYFPDGQIKDEVYEYGSFLQSKMYQAGVVCSDCHNPHSATLRTPVVDLCVSCHDPGTFDDKTHHLHAPSAEVTCVDCHMPQRTYMGVDARRDHQFSVPRPDLTLSLGTPNACDSCHQNRPKWAAAMIEAGLGAERPESFAPIFHAAQERDVNAPALLGALIGNEKKPAIVRASALARWAELGRASKEFDDAVGRCSKDKDVLVRRAAAEAAAVMGPDSQAKVLDALFGDPVRSVRVAAALASLSGPAPEKIGEAMGQALAEAKAARTHDSDRAEGLLALAQIAERLKNEKETDRLYNLAAKRYPDSSVVFVNWADALRELKQEERAQEVLLEGLKLHPAEPSLLHSRGLWLVRQKKVQEALPLLQQGYDKAPATLRRRYGYVYAVAVQETGDWAEALAILRELKNQYPEAEEVQHAITLYEEKRATKK